VKRDLKKKNWFDDEEFKTNVDITIVNGLRKLRSNELEDLILGIDYVNIFPITKYPLFLVYLNHYMW
jgi:hypothetical protein